MAGEILKRGRGVPVSFDDLRREMDDMMTRFFGETTASDGVWFAPSANVSETDTEYRVSVDLPGMKPEDVSVELKGGSLWITGERKHETEESGKTWRRIESRFGRFQKVIPLDDADAENVDAQFKDGVLNVTLKKVESAKTRKIPVKG